MPHALCSCFLGSALCTQLWPRQGIPWSYERWHRVLAKGSDCAGNKREPWREELPAVQRARLREELRLQLLAALSCGASLGSHGCMAGGEGMCQPLCLSVMAHALHGGPRTGERSMLCLLSPKTPSANACPVELSSPAAEDSALVSMFLSTGCE